MNSLCDKSIFASCSARACKFKERNDACMINHPGWKEERKKRLEEHVSQLNFT